MKHQQAGIGSEYLSLSKPNRLRVLSIAVIFDRNL
jgi:hypothetical protein